MKQRLLYIAPFIGVPPSSGASLRALNLLEQLACQYEIVLLTYPPQNFRDMFQWCHHRNIKLQSLTIPAVYARDASFLHRLFASRLPGFASHNPVGIARDVDQAWNMHGPFHISYFATQLMGQALLVKNWPSFRIIDLYDVYAQFAYEKRRSVSKLKPFHWLYRIEELRVRRYENQILKRADLILVVSEKDRIELSGRFNKRQVYIIPNGVTVPSERSTSKSNTIITVGTYHYEPNFQGIVWFYQQVWPQIRLMAPLAQWIVVGNGGDRVTSITHSDTSVTVTGLVPTVDPYYRDASCAVIPIQSGAGTHLKLLEAMAWAVPVVTTRKGAEGINHRGSVHVTDDPVQFAKAIVDCLQNPEPAYQRALQARSIVVEKYSWDQIGESLRQVLTQHVHTN